jgi:hypothetical protein
MAKRIVLTAVVAAALVAALVTAHGWPIVGSAQSAPPSAHRAPSRTPTPIPAEVTLVPRAPAQNVPASFLGLSTEYWALPIWEREDTVLVRVLSDLREPGTGPMVLRIGGDSADETLWQPRMRKIPEWVIELTPAWLRETSQLVRRSGIRVLLDLNLLTASPQIAAEWARAAQSALPQGSITGLEIGNEPDLYDRQYWLQVTAGSRTILPLQLTAADYARDFLAYARALSAAAPGVPLLGPAVAHPKWSANWIATLLARPHPGLRAVSAHEYPYSACAAPGESDYPTIGKLLSERATAGVARSVQHAVELAHRAGLAFRLTELNSVTCGGLPGVSDTFATALWAPDALFELMHAGVDSAYVHVRPRTINAAFALGRRGLEARPLLYGLAMFSRTLGADARLLPVRVHTRWPAHLKAWAVQVRGPRLHVLLINKGSRAVSASLRLPGSGRAAVQRLLARSAAARTGETLDGQWLGRDGLWHGTRATGTIAGGAHGYRLTVPGYSAALLSMRLAIGRRSSERRKATGAHHKLRA